MTIAARIDALSNKIATAEQTRERFLEENKWSPAYWSNRWFRDQDCPDGSEYAEAKAWIERAQKYQADGDTYWANMALEEAEQEAREARGEWEKYRLRNDIAEAEVSEVKDQVTLATQVTAGVGFVGMTQGAALVTAAFWTRFAAIGGASAVARTAYDAVETALTGEPKEPEELFWNSAKAFVGGGLCGIPFKGLLAYNYVSLDLVGDLSQRYLTDIREKHGDLNGTIMAEGFLITENVLAAAALVPYLGTWGRAAKAAIGATAISVGLETYLQMANERSLEEIDPGRFVGMSAWGHSIILLPEAMLKGVAAAVGWRQSVSRALGYGTKYVVFINPSVNNFSARVSQQNWWNVQTGNTARHSTVMMLSRYVESMYGPSRFAVRVFDETLGGASIAVADKVWPVYEDIPGFEKEEPARPTVVALAKD